MYNVIYTILYCNYSPQFDVRGVGPEIAHFRRRRYWLPIIAGYASVTLPICRGWLPICSLGRSAVGRSRAVTEGKNPFPKIFLRKKECGGVEKPRERRGENARFFATFRKKLRNGPENDLEKARKSAENREFSS